ncbi:crossover junction endonuclease EME1B-like isoform X2 [Abrus precatorius]|uniref:Crossover junction endonuclease EME1B-like isoform X2 n=1 Tax=Abrus precatorius TaxID=3816 RepID=A0A8B8M9I7_ABRPR|nr:crossover junction endonuclease EME1B-like isoform X2 [Abrus precatorius]
MMDPIILSDEEDLSTPFPLHSKKRRTQSNPNQNPTVLILDDDPTPQKSSTPSIVPETPMSALLDSDVAIVKCTYPSSPSHHSVRVSPKKFSGISQMILLESDNESENCGTGKLDENETRGLSMDIAGDSRWSSNSLASGSSPGGNAARTEMSGDNPSNPTSSQVENMSIEQEESVENMKRSKVSAKGTAKAMGKTKMTKEERSRLMEEKKLQKEQEKLRKAALKAEAAEMKKIEKEKQKWEKGKFAIKSIVAEIDAKVVESGSIGGHLLSRFAEKGLAYHITSNPITGSILWSMKVPEHISQHSAERIDIPYILLVYEAEQFCNLTMNDSLFYQLSSIRSHYPAYTVCYITNRLLAYINKREQEKYKHPENNNCWRRPPVEEVLAKLTTNFNKVHSRQCVDEAELAEHVVGLTSSLASCQFRKKLTRLSVSANGSLIPKDSVDRNLIKKSSLKALVAIPKVQPRFAIAIWKKYPTMKSLLSSYMDPSKSVHEKEFLLKDLMTEGLLGGDRRLGEVCSKRVYRILMAQSGSIRTDDVENGADFFER